MRYTLCSHCLNAGRCTYRRGRTGVLNCEEFDGGAPRPSLRRPAAVRSGRSKPGNPAGGLCVTCDLRRSCRFPKPAGDVWLCEECR